MKRIHRSSSPRAIRLISLALCYALIVTTAFLPLSPSVNAGAQGSNPGVVSSSGSVQPAGLLGAPARLWASLITFLQGGGPPNVPGPNLPNLDAMKVVPVHGSCGTASDSVRASLPGLYAMPHVWSRRRKPSASG